MTRFCETVVPDFALATSPPHALPDGLSAHGHRPEERVLLPATSTDAQPST